MKKKGLVLLFALALAAAPGAFARQEARGEGCECERRCERRPDRPQRYQDRESIERLRRLRELRRMRERLERVLRPFDLDGDGRLNEAERRRVRAIRERRRERRWKWMREARERWGHLSDTEPGQDPPPIAAPSRAGTI